MNNRNTISRIPLIALYTIGIATILGVSQSAYAILTHCESKNFENIVESCAPLVPGQNNCSQDEFACEVETYTANACVNGPGWCTQLANPSTVTVTVRQRRCNNLATGGCTCNVNGYEYSHYTYSKEIFECQT